MKTYTAKPREIEQAWRLVDADGQILGRLATEIADTLRGKNKLAAAQLRKLKVYAGPEHPHAAQNPAPLKESS